MELLSIGSQLSAIQREFEKLKEKYENFKCDVSIKLKFLDENQVSCRTSSWELVTALFSMSCLQTKVMKKQLLLFHNAIAAYFSGNQQALDATMKQFNLKLTSNGDCPPEKTSFLEQSTH